MCRYKNERNMHEEEKLGAIVKINMKPKEVMKISKESLEDG